MNKNGWSLGVGTTNGYLHMYDLRNMNGPYLSAKAHDTSVYCVKFIPDLLFQNNTSSLEKEYSKNCYMSNLNGNTSIIPTNENSMKRSNSYNNYEMSSLANSKQYLDI
jgi:hypothetical protein